MIDYILGITNQSKLFYIGHSQGTTSFFVMCSEKPEYNDKIRLMSAFAPVAYMSRITNPFFQLLSNFHDSLEVSWCLYNFVQIKLGHLTRKFLVKNKKAALNSVHYEQLNAVLLFFLISPANLYFLILSGCH